MKWVKGVKVKTRKAKKKKKKLKEDIRSIDKNLIIKENLKEKISN